MGSNDCGSPCRIRPIRIFRSGLQPIDSSCLRRSSISLRYWLTSPPSSSRRFGSYSFPSICEGDSVSSLIVFGEPYPGGTSVSFVVVFGDLVVGVSIAIPHEDVEQQSGALVPLIDLGSILVIVASVFFGFLWFVVWVKDVRKFVHACKCLDLVLPSSPVALCSVKFDLGNLSFVLWAHNLLE